LQEKAVRSPDLEEGMMADATTKNLKMLEEKASRPSKPLVDARLLTRF
jgi:hypothetical protein